MAEDVVRSGLTLLDWLILAGYFVFIVWLGSRFAKRQRSTERYFLGKRGLPGWAVGLSMFATIISSWAFIALPGKSFRDDMQQLMTVALIPLCTLLAVRFFIPLFRNKIRLSAYEYLENRFGLPARVYGNLAFIVVHFGKMGAILYLVSLAVASMTGWNLFLIIAAVGSATLLYTYFGGIEGVVWSDVIQGFLLISGGIAALIMIFVTAPGGSTHMLETMQAGGKLKLISLQFDLQGTSLLVFLIFGCNFYLQKYVSDQTVVQRYLLSPTKNEASRALWISSALIMFVWVLFMSIGAALWAYYRLNPDLLPPELWQQPDRVFPYFIGHQLPAGVSGLILAGLLAATMSTLSSDLNSLGAVLNDDYYAKIAGRVTDRKQLLFSRLSVLISGLLAILLAMAMTRIQSMADAAFNFVSLVAGGVLGMYLLGLFTRRCSPRGLYAGIVTGILVILWAYFSTAHQISWLPRFPLNTLWIGLLGNVVVFVTGLGFSLVLSPKYRSGSHVTVIGNIRTEE